MSNIRKEFDFKDPLFPGEWVRPPYWHGCRDPQPRPLSGLGGTEASLSKASPCCPHTLSLWSQWRRSPVPPCLGSSWRGKVSQVKRTKMWYYRGRINQRGWQVYDGQLDLRPGGDSQATWLGATGLLRPSRTCHWSGGWTRFQSGWQAARSPSHTRLRIKYWIHAHPSDDLRPFSGLHCSPWQGEWSSGDGRHSVPNWPWAHR